MSISSFHVRKCRTVLDSGFHAVDSGFQVLHSGVFVRGTWILDSDPLLDPYFLSCIADSTAQDSGSQKKKIPRFNKQILPAIRIPLHGQIFMCSVLQAIIPLHELINTYRLHNISRQNFGVRAICVLKLIQPALFQFNCSCIHYG